VVTWGDPLEGGDSSAVREQLKSHVRDVQATCGAFAAIKEDGSVVTWGEETVGGDSSAVQDQLYSIEKVQAGRLLFVAVSFDSRVAGPHGLMDIDIIALAWALTLRSQQIFVVGIGVAPSRNARLNMQTEGPGGKVNMKLKLPGSQWFSQLVQKQVPDWKGKASVWTDKYTRRHSETDVRVLADVQAGFEYRGPLTAWSKEETYLHEYLQQASDAFSLRCTRLCVFQGHLTVKCPQRLSRPMWCPGPINLQDFCNAAGQRAEDVCAQLRVTQAELRAFLAAPVCMQIHALFLTLMEKCAWNSIMNRVAWLPPARDPAHRLCMDFFSRVGVPSLEFRQQQQQQRSSAGHSIGNMSTAEAAGASERSLLFTTEHAQNLLGDLLRWSPVLLAELAEDERVSEQLVLEEHALRLQRLVRSAEPQGIYEGGQGGRKSTLDVRHLVKCLCAAMKLRNRGELKSVLKLALDSMPGVAGLDSIEDSAFKVPSAASLSRAQLLVDLTYCCYWQKKLESMRGSMFIWLDASPQGGVDWLLSVLRYVPDTSLRAAVSAAKYMESSPTLFARAREQGNSVLMQQIAQARHQNRLLLRRCLHMHRLLPGGVGSGASAVEQKIASLVHKLLCETQSFSLLRQLVHINTDFEF
ncbi:HERC1, partial [Symbiodinium sp. KB8]